MKSQYLKYAYLETAAAFASNVAELSGMHENRALARAVVSDVYQSIKKDHKLFDAASLLDAAKKLCGDVEAESKGDICASEPSEMLVFKLFCFESYIEAKHMSEAEGARVFVQNGIGSYLETVYDLMMADSGSIVLDIDIYIHARQVAHESEL